MLLDRVLVELALVLEALACCWSAKIGQPLLDKATALVELVVVLELMAWHQAIPLAMVVLPTCKTAPALVVLQSPASDILPWAGPLLS